eukprot:7114197-Alexandrium_andersonii.AAC.1
MGGAALCPGLCPLQGAGGPGESESSDVEPGPVEAEEGRELRVAHGPAAPSDEERKRRDCTRVPFRSCRARCVRG